jgi:glycosyltransferase involved in cell wall biosynthesis
MAAVSVLIPAYNTEKYIAETIRSVIAQTFTDWELIVVDDRSTDGTADIVAGFAAADARIKLIRNQENLGMMGNWNYGLSLCTARYFVKLDCDDVWAPEMLQACYTILEQDPSVGMVFSQYRLIDDNNQPLPSIGGDLPAYARNAAFTGTSLVKRGTYGMLMDNVLKQGIGLIRRRIFEEIGPFSLHDSGDTEMWYRIGAHYRIYGINQVYYSYRVRPDNFTRTQILKLSKRERNLYDVRRMIITYYYQQGQLTASEYHAFMRDNQFEYDKSALYAYRVQGKWGKALQLLAGTLLRHPLRMTRFYFGRLADRFTRKESSTQTTTV